MRPLPGVDRVRVCPNHGAGDALVQIRSSSAVPAPQSTDPLSPTVKPISQTPSLDPLRRDLPLLSSLNLLSHHDADVQHSKTSNGHTDISDTQSRPSASRPPLAFLPQFTSSS
jgi:hypothetical protein